MLLCCCRWKNFMTTQLSSYLCIVIYKTSKEENNCLNKYRNSDSSDRKIVIWSHCGRLTSPPPWQTRNLPCILFHSRVASDAARRLGQLSMALAGCRSLKRLRLGPILGSVSTRVFGTSSSTLAGRSLVQQKSSCTLHDIVSS